MLAVLLWARLLRRRVPRSSGCCAIDAGADGPSRLAARFCGSPRSESLASPTKRAAASASVIHQVGRPAPSSQRVAADVRLCAPTGLAASGDASVVTRFQAPSLPPAPVVPP